METKIVIEKVYGNVRKDRLGVVVYIKNKDQTFKWMPTYKQIEEVLMKLRITEYLNKSPSSLLTP